MYVRIQYDSCQGLYIARIMHDKCTVAVMTFADEPTEETIWDIYFAARPKLELIAA